MNASQRRKKLRARRLLCTPGRIVVNFTTGQRAACTGKVERHHLAEVSTPTGVEWWPLGDVLFPDIKVVDNPFA